MILLTNARVLTLDPALPETDRLLIGTDGRIAAVGAQCPDTAAQVIDLQGYTLIPGLQDPHIHVWKVGDLLKYRLDLRGVGSKTDMLDAIADFARSTAGQPDSWVLARGFNEALFTDNNGQIPTREDLDKVIPDRLCQVIRTCAHIAVVNSRTLAHCGITAQTQPPSGGEIRRDASGQPNGILTETALGLVAKHIPPPAAADYRQMILAAQDALLRAGVTTATDPAVHPELLEVYHQMEAAGELRIRVHAIPIRVPDGASTALPLPKHYESDFLKVNTVKFFADGGISGKTAAVLHPYKGTTDEYGVLRLEHVFFEALARESQAAGFRIATHAIGDAAIGRVLDVYESIQNDNTTGLRHRIEHLGLPTKAHLRRMQAMGTWCVTQPMFIGELGRNMRQYLPDHYLHQVYPFRSVLEAGVGLAFSSDAPVVRDFSPLHGMYHASTRLDLEGYAIGRHEGISTLQALKAYTTDAAKANGDATTGQIKVGMWADLTLLDGDPSDLEALKNMEVRAVWVGGERIVF
jgi:predicted amidohydrolase YtcJ